MTRIPLTPIVFVMSMAAPPLWSESLDGFVPVDHLPGIENPVLSQGRDVWGAARLKRDGGKALVGAPKMTDDTDWAKGLAQELPRLFAHAIDGFHNRSDMEMPARSGDPDLRDDPVRVAVVAVSGGASDVQDWHSNR